MRNALFAIFSTAMLSVTLAPRRAPATAPPSRASSKMTASGWQLQAAWLAQRESAVGDWESVKPPLRDGDELQLTVLASADAFVYVLDENRRQLFPPPNAAPSLAKISAHWPYAIPATHQSWRLDGAEHDRFYLVAARHPLADPLATLEPARSTLAVAAPDLELPLRDGRHGAASTRVLMSEEVIVDYFDAR